MGFRLSIDVYKGYTPDDPDGASEAAAAKVSECAAELHAHASVPGQWISRVCTAQLKHTRHVASNRRLLLWQAFVEKELYPRMAAHQRIMVSGTTAMPLSALLPFSLLPAPAPPLPPPPATRLPPPADFVQSTKFSQTMRGSRVDFRSSPVPSTDDFYPNAAVSGRSSNLPSRI